MKKVLLILSVLFLAIFTVLFSGANTTDATGQDTCPDGDGWVKVDDLSGHSYTYPTPEGFEVTDNCYKHSTYVHFGTGDTVETDTHSEYKCTGPWWNLKCEWKDIRHELSHASFLLVSENGEEEEICEDEEALNYGKEEECEYEEEPTPTPTDTEEEPTPTNTPTPTPTTKPGNGGTGGPGDGLSDGRSDGRSDGLSSGVGGAAVLGVAAKRGEVLGASTMAATGSFPTTLASMEQVFGIALMALGAGLHGKKKFFKKTK